MIFSAGPQLRRWTRLGGLQNLGITAGGLVVTSTDGNVAACCSFAPSIPPFRWTAAGGAQPLALSGLDFVSGMSEDGNVITTNDFFLNGRSFLWDASHGARELQTAIASDYGLPAAFEGWSEILASAISANGRYIAGTAYGNRGYAVWRLDLEGPAPPACSDGLDNDGDGFVDYPDDPGCPSPEAFPENPVCDDALDNDGDGLTDFDDPLCQASALLGISTLWAGRRVGGSDSDRHLAIGAEADASAPAVIPRSSDELWHRPRRRGLPE